jgi:hypothetical protein
MASFKQIGNKIFIDGLEIPFEVFKILEPNYNPQSGMEALNYNGEVLVVRTNGITSTISGKWKDGERYIQRKKDFISLLGMLRKEDSEVNEEVNAITDPSGCRKNAFPNIDELVVALWEHIVEKKSLNDSGIDELQMKRISVKDKYPLKETSNASDKLTGETEGLLPKGTRRTRSRNKHSG